MAAELDPVKTVNTAQMQKQFSPLSKYAAGHGFVVVTWERTPGAVIMSGEAWESAQREHTHLAVPDTARESWPATDVPAKLSALHETLTAGRHVAVTARNRLRAMVVPAAWAYRAFPQLGLPDPDAPPTDQVLIVYRSARLMARMRGELAGSPDLEREMDARVTAGATAIPLERRERLRAVVYVIDGRIARIRGVDPVGEWVDLPGGAMSLAPVSDPLSVTDIDALVPGLGMYPGGEWPMTRGVAREFVDL